MAWLSENWTYLLVLVGVLLLMRFSGMGCGMGGGRGHSDHRHGGRGDDHGPAEAGSATDPVSQRPVDPRSAVATLYQGRAYYFESRQNRDRFEAAPDQFAKTPAAHDGKEQRDGGHGCC